MRPACTHHLHQRGHVGKTTDLAKGAGRLFKIQVRVGVGQRCALRNSVLLEKGLSNHVGHLALHPSHTNVDIRLAEIDRHQLGVTVGEMQKAHIAKFGDVIELVALLGRRLRVWKPAKHACCRCSRHHPHKLPPIHVHYRIPIDEYRTKKKALSQGKGLVDPAKAPGLLIHRGGWVEQQRHDVLHLALREQSCMTEPRHVGAGVVGLGVVELAPGVLNHRIAIAT